MNREKQIKKISKLLGYLFQLSSYMMLFATLLAVIGIILYNLSPNTTAIPVAFLKDMMTPTTSETTFMSFGNPSVDLAMLSFNIESIAIVALCLAYFFLSRKALKIFKTIVNCRTPFTLTLASQIRKISVLILMTCLWIPIIKGIILLIFTQGGQFTIDLGGIVLTLIIYGISLIFEYGLLLQREVDETI